MYNVTIPWDNLNLDFIRNVRIAYRNSSLRVVSFKDWVNQNLHAELDEETLDPNEGFIIKFESEQHYLFTVLKYT